MGTTIQFTVAVIMAIDSFGATAAWIQMGQSSRSGGYTTYVEQDSAQRDANKVKIWTMTDFASKQVNGYEYLSNRAQREYDCKTRQTRALYLTVHSMNMLGGVIVDTMNVPMKWSSVTPGSVAEAFFNFACGKRAVLPSDVMPETEAEVQRFLIQASGDMNKQLPSGNEYSTLVKTFVLPGRRLVYYSIVYPASGPTTPEKIANAKQIAINTLCSHPDPILRGYRVTMEYTNVDPKGKFLYSVSASPKDCR